jgi:hypothetical protein
MYFVFMYENGTMRPVEIVLKRQKAGRWDKEKDGGSEFD